MQPNHAHPGGECRFGRCYAGGEFLPFYVPRPVMPQVDWADMPALLEFLPTIGVEVTRLYGVDPRSLLAHQRINRHMALTMPESALGKPVLISADNYVLDGNHRWFAHLVRHQPIDCLALSLPFDPALDALFRFPRTYAYGDGKPHPVTV